MDLNLVRAIWKWKYEEDWVAYDLKTCLKLESYHQGGIATCPVEANGKIFLVNMNFMEQVNTRNKLRPVMRSNEGYAFWKWHDGTQLCRFEPDLELSLEKAFSGHLKLNDDKFMFNGIEIFGYILNIPDMKVTLVAKYDLITYSIIRIFVEPYIQDNEDPTNNATNVTQNSNTPITEQSAVTQNSITPTTEQSARSLTRSTNNPNTQVKKISKSGSIFLSIIKFFKAGQRNEKCYPVASHIFKKLNISSGLLGNVTSDGALDYKGLESIIKQCDELKIFQAARAQDDDCAICLAPMKDDVIKLSKCPHHFHSSCFKIYIYHSQKAGILCPQCCATIHKGNGPCPKGTMLWSILSTPLLEGYPNCGTIIILYIIPKGTQTVRHLNPGRPFVGTMRAAYLPNNKEGNIVFKLLQRAFEEGHTFTVGDSVTTGRTNVVTWNGIHHKTSRSGGSLFYGFPDPTYFERVLVELKEKGIEPIEEDLTT